VTGREEGFTLVETVIGLFLSLIVVLALGGVMLLNQRAYGWGRDKIFLQQNVSESLERLAQLVRMSARLRAVSPVELWTYDESGVQTHTVRRAVVAGEGRLQVDGSDIVDRSCTLLDVQPNGDTTAVTITLELGDDSGNLVQFRTQSALRSRDFEF
jgi:hypothetical protein